MRFSVVGQLRAALPLLQQVHESADHQLGTCHLTGALAEAAAGLMIPFRLESEAENAFLDNDIDVVVLAAAAAEQTLQWARSASQADRHVVVFAPHDASPAFGFELHQLLDESRRSIVPVLGRMRLSDLQPGQMWTGVPGDANSERTSPDESGSAALPAQIARDVQQMMLELDPGSDDAAVLRQWQLESLDIVSAAGFRYTQITAIEGMAPSGLLISRLLTLGTSKESESAFPPASIMLRPAAASSVSAGGADRTAVTAAGRDGSRDLSVLRVIRTDGTEIRWPVLEPPRVLAWVVALCCRGDACQRCMESFTESLELAHAAERSLTRRRTVDIHFDSGSERSLFKSQMTAIGCGVLTWTIMGFIGFAMIRAILPQLPPPVLLIGRILFFAPLVLFLLAQLLLPLARDRNASK